MKTRTDKLPVRRLKPIRHFISPCHHTIIALRIFDPDGGAVVEPHQFADCDCGARSADFRLTDDGYESTRSWIDNHKCELGKVVKP